MIHSFDERQLVMAKSALNVLIANYAAIEAKEPDPRHKTEMIQCRESGERTLERFRRFSAGEHDLSPGDVLVLERALRMSMNKWQTMIKPSMSAEQKALHRESAEEVSVEITRIRKIRGLPW